MQKKKNVMESLKIITRKMTMRRRTTIGNISLMGSSSYCKKPSISNNISQILMKNITEDHILLKSSTNTEKKKE